MWLKLKQILFMWLWERLYEQYLNAGKTGFVFSTWDRQAAAASAVCRGQTTQSQIVRFNFITIYLRIKCNLITGNHQNIGS